MPRIQFTEPVSPRYIHINPSTNKIHLLVPVVGGLDISTDNTCKTWTALREFFDGGAVRELNGYKEALAFDIQVLAVEHPQRAAKEERLAQIEAYIESILAMRETYGEAMRAFIAKPSNLYSIQLRPREQDTYSRTINPVFNVNRKNNGAGEPLSSLYMAMHRVFPSVQAKAIEPRTRLIREVLNVRPESSSFRDLQQALGEQSMALFGLAIDFTRSTDGGVVTKESIDALMGFGQDATREDYIEALLGACARDVWEMLPTPPFYSISGADRAEKTERLSILTQFFLANLNVYCRARGISDQNFGVILDGSPDLSNELVSVVSTALACGEDVESAICNFCFAHDKAFGLSRALSPEDLTAIRQTFERNYRTVATGENPHMDDFMILDKDATGETAKFVAHQGSICVNFAEIIDPAASSSKPDYFASVRADFAIHPAEVTHRNECVAGDVEVDIDTLLARTNDEQFERLPKTVRMEALANFDFRLHHFLHHVAKGRQAEADALLKASPDLAQTLLRAPGRFTDYSGRTFNCTAYEYAYWAKDYHMLNIFWSVMDMETSAYMLERIEKNDREGLRYQQNGEEHCSMHFDFTPLKAALQEYIDGTDEAAMEAALLKVGLAQRNVPAHVAQEYCRIDRAFDPCPTFNEDNLPRSLTFFNRNRMQDESWFPLPSTSTGLGFDFGIVRGASTAAVGLTEQRWPFEELDRRKRLLRLDFDAIDRLDEVRTRKVLMMRNLLEPAPPTPDWMA